VRILITGGFGYIGGRLGQYFHSAGHEILLGTRKAGLAPDWLPQAELRQIEWMENSSLNNVCSDVDVVIHAAGMNAEDCNMDPVGALEFNGLATARLVEAAGRSGVRKFIYLSTAHVYANPLVGVISENQCPSNLHTYATSHLAGENAVLNANLRKEVEGIVLRLSNGFGVPSHKDVNCWMLLVNDLCRQVVTKGTLTLRSSGLQRRDFVTLHDVSHFVAYMIEMNSAVLGNGVFNVGGAWAPRIVDMAELIQARCMAVLGYSPRINREATDSAEKTLDLNYKIDKLLGTGFKLSGSAVEEIDATLLLCRECFGGNK